MIFRRRWIAFSTAAVMLFTAGFCTLRVGSAQADPVAALPKPGTMLRPSVAEDMPMLSGVSVDPADPLNVMLTVSRPHGRSVTDAEIDSQVRLFLAALAVPASDMWVNLSPYEKERVAGDSLQGSALADAMLAQDYVLKQFAASLTHPDTATGKAYWAARSASTGSATEVDTLDKIWIVPQSAKIWQDGAKAILGETLLDVKTAADHEGVAKTASASNAIQSALFDALRREINHGKNFAELRALYRAVVLATWCKGRFKGSVYDAYADKGLTLHVSGADGAQEKVYGRYTEAFKKGVYGFMRTEGNLRRKYFSGGETFVGVSSAIKVQDGAAPEARHQDEFDVSVNLVSGDSAAANLQRRHEVPQKQQRQEDPKKAIAEQKKFMARVDRRLPLLIKMFVEDHDVRDRVFAFGVFEDARKRGLASRDGVRIAGVARSYYDHAKKYNGDTLAGFAGTVFELMRGGAELKTRDRQAYWKRAKMIVALIDVGMRSKGSLLSLWGSDEVFPSFSKKDARAFLRAAVTGLILHEIQFAPSRDALRVSGDDAIYIRDAVKGLHLSKAASTRAERELSAVFDVYDRIEQQIWSQNGKLNTRQYVDVWIDRLKASPEIAKKMGVAVGKIMDDMQRGYLTREEFIAADARKDRVIKAVSGFVDVIENPYDFVVKEQKEMPTFRLKIPSYERSELIAVLRENGFFGDDARYPVPAAALDELHALIAKARAPFDLAEDGKLLEFKDDRDMNPREKVDAIFEKYAVFPPQQYILERDVTQVAYHTYISRESGSDMYLSDDQKLALEVELLRLLKEYARNQDENNRLRVAEEIGVLLSPENVFADTEKAMRAEMDRTGYATLNKEKVDKIVARAKAESSSSGVSKEGDDADRNTAFVMQVHHRIPEVISAIRQTPELKAKYFGNDSFLDYESPLFANGISAAIGRIFSFKNPNDPNEIAKRYTIAEQSLIDATLEYYRNNKFADGHTIGQFIAVLENVIRYGTIDAPAGMTKRVGAPITETDILTRHRAKKLYVLINGAVRQKDPATPSFVDRINTGVKMSPKKRGLYFSVLDAYVNKRNTLDLRLKSLPRRWESAVANNVHDLGEMQQILSFRRSYEADLREVYSESAQELVGKNGMTLPTAQAFLDAAWRDYSHVEDMIMTAQGKIPTREYIAGWVDRLKTARDSGDNTLFLQEAAAMRKEMGPHRYSIFSEVNMQHWIMGEEVNLDDDAGVSAINFTGLFEKVGSRYVPTPSDVGGIDLGTTAAVAGVTPVALAAVAIDDEEFNGFDYTFQRTR